MELDSFLGRVLERVPTSPPDKFIFEHWKHAGRPTEEALGIMPVPGLDPEKLLQVAMDVDHYVGNVDHVVECRSIEDSRFTPPESVRFYQKIDLPMLGAIHHELVLKRLGEHKGYQCAGWDILKDETNALPTKKVFRSDYSHGIWLAAPGVIGYALGSAPKREDVGFLKWKALTSGADVAASRVLKANLEVMAKWAANV